MYLCFHFPNFFFVFFFCPHHHNNRYANHYQCVEHLLAHGGDTEIATIDDATTPLFAASERGNPSIVKLLLAHGANMFMVTNDAWKWTPAVAAASNGHLEVVQLLIAHGSSRDKCVEVATFAQKDAILEWLDSTSSMTRVEMLVGLQMHEHLSVLLRLGYTSNSGVAGSTKFRPQSKLANPNARICGADVLPDSLPFGRLAAMSKMPWVQPESAERKRALASFVALVSNGWSERAHWLHGPSIRKVVHLMLLIAERLWRIQEGLHTPPPGSVGGASTTFGSDDCKFGAKAESSVPESNKSSNDGGDGASNAALQLDQPTQDNPALSMLPVLPAELWTCGIFRFMPRDDTLFP